MERVPGEERPHGQREGQVPTEAGRWPLGGQVSSVVDRCCSVGSGNTVTR